MAVGRQTGSKRAALIEEQRKQERDRRAAASEAANKALQKAWEGKFEAWANASEDSLDKLQQKELDLQRHLLQEESHLKYLTMQTSAEDCCL